MNFEMSHKKINRRVITETWRWPQTFARPCSDRNGLGWGKLTYAGCSRCTQKVIQPNETTGRFSPARVWCDVFALRCTGGLSWTSYVRRFGYVMASIMTTGVWSLELRAELRWEKYWLKCRNVFNLDRSLCFVQVTFCSSGMYEWQIKFNSKLIN